MKRQRGGRSSLADQRNTGLTPEKERRRKERREEREARSRSPTGRKDDATGSQANLPSSIDAKIEQMKKARLQNLQLQLDSHTPTSPLLISSAMTLRSMEQRPKPQISYSYFKLPEKSPTLVGVVGPFGGDYEENGNIILHDHMLGV